MKVANTPIIETNGAAGVDSVALRDLINGKTEIGSVKRRAYGELKKLSRTLIGLALLADDLGDAASLDEAMVEVRREHDRLSVEKAALTADIAQLKATAESQRTQVGELTSQVEQVTERVEALEREERRLNPTVEKFQAIEASIEASQRLLGEQRAEEARLKPIVRDAQDIERRLPERQQALADIERKLAAIRQSI